MAFRIGAGFEPVSTGLDWYALKAAGRVGSSPQVRIWQCGAAWESVRQSLLQILAIFLIVCFLFSRGFFKMASDFGEIFPKSTKLVLGSQILTGKLSRVILGVVYPI